MIAKTGAVTPGRSPRRRAVNNTESEATDAVVRQIRALPIYKSETMQGLASATGLSRGTLMRDATMTLATRRALLAFLLNKKKENLDTAAKIDDIVAKLKAV